jgi:hypothetical protein
MLSTRAAILKIYSFFSLQSRAGVGNLCDVGRQKRASGGAFATAQGGSSSISSRI